VGMVFSSYRLDGALSRSLLRKTLFDHLHLQPLFLGLVFKLATDVLQRDACGDASAFSTPPRAASQPMPSLSWNFGPRLSLGMLSA